MTASGYILREDALRRMSRSLRALCDIDVMLMPDNREACYWHAGIGPADILAHDDEAAGLELLRRKLFGIRLGLSDIAVPSPSDLRKSA